MNNDEPPQEQQISPEDEARRARLAQHTGERTRGHSEKYSVFVRRMRLFLPLAAVIILVALMTWPQSSDNIVATEEEQQEHYKAVKKNELLNPRFESMDEKQQPFTVTAAKAVQSEKDEELLILDKPFGDMLLNSNNWVTIEADEGFFQQAKEQLLLRGAVKITHDEGYEMRMPELHVNMAENTLNTDKPVEGAGPQGRIWSQGMHGNRTENRIVFTGPARLILKDVSFMNGLSPADKNGSADEGKKG